jgi:hypothetical protein
MAGHVSLIGLLNHQMMVNDSKGGITCVEWKGLAEQIQYYIGDWATASDM